MNNPNTWRGNTQTVQLGRNMSFTSPLAGEDVRRTDEGVLKRNTLFCIPSPRCLRTRPLPQGARRGTAHGFTLIELLVVILILGILAAVALPQYKKAVYKARTAEAVTMVKALANAAEIYYLTNGNYTNDVSELEVDVPIGREYLGESQERDPNKYYFDCDKNQQCTARIDNEDMPDIQFMHVNGPAKNPGKMYCIAYSSAGNGIGPKSDLALSICKSMGYELLENAWKPGYYFVIN